MKILLALHGMRPEFTGGCEVYVERLARALLEAGHSCSILAGARPAAATLAEKGQSGQASHGVTDPAGLGALRERLAGDPAASLQFWSLFILDAWVRQLRA